MAMKSLKRAGSGFQRPWTAGRHIAVGRLPGHHDQDPGDVVDVGGAAAALLDRLVHRVVVLGSGADGRLEAGRAQLRPDARDELAEVGVAPRVTLVDQAGDLVAEVGPGLLEV
jgi:hypothetical protein